MLRGLLCVMTLAGVLSGTSLSAEEKIKVPADVQAGVTAKTHLLQAQKFAQFGMHQDAIIEFKKSLEALPDFVDAHFELGQVYANIDRHDDAIREYKNTLELEPHHNKVVYELALAYYDTNMTDEGIELCKFYLKDNDPGKANLHSLLGVFYIKKGDTDRAVSEFRKQLEANHHPEQGYLNLGMALMKKGETDEAIESYKKSLELFPRNPRTHYQLGAAYKSKGMNEEAEKEMAEYRGLVGR